MQGPDYVQLDLGQRTRPRSHLWSSIPRFRQDASGGPIRTYIAFLACGVTALALGSAASADTRRLTVDESVRIGLRRYPELRAADAEAEAARAARRRARAARYPSLSAAARYTRLGGDIPEVEIPLPDAGEDLEAFQVPRNQVHTEARIEHVLFSAPRRSRIRAAQHSGDAASERAELAQADVAFAIRRAYWELRRAESHREALTAARARAKEHVQTVRALVDEGAALRSELMRARARRADVGLELTQARHAVRTRQLDLSRLLGLPPETRVEPTSRADLEATDPGVGDVEPPPRGPLAAHPELGALRAEASARAAEADAESVSWLPEVSLFGRAIYARPNPYFFAGQDELRGSFELGAALEWTLWQGGTRRHAAAEARARQRAARARLEGARRELGDIERKRRLSLRQTAEAGEVASQSARAAGEALRVVRAQFREGAAQNADVLDAEAEKRAADAALIDARAEYAIARAAVLHARGRVE